MNGTPRPVRTLGRRATNAASARSTAREILPFAMLAALLAPQSADAQARRFYPAPEPVWETRAPAQVGLNAALIQEAVAIAQAGEMSTTRDLEAAHYDSFGREPLGFAVGPFKERGPQTGIIVKDGYIVAEWGEPHRVDMTFSVSKSFVSTTVGLAFDRGLIRDVNDPVHPYMAPIVALQRSPIAAEGGVNPLGSTGTISLFDTEHNRKITWDDLLRQTSDWEGTLWGKPDWADRPGRGAASGWRTAERSEPGTTYEYNDTRVNLLALAALNVWRQPLPKVLRENVMDPIGASPTWRWLGYDNSWVVIDGQAIQSVSGGGHWGGGMFISARDMARFGLLTVRAGRWNDKQILSDAWISMARTPTPAQDSYGFMNFFLNRYRSGTPSSFSHVGNGTNVIYCDPDNDLVIVLRWIENGAIDEVIAKVMQAMGG